MLLKYRSIGKSEHKLVVSGKKRDVSIDVLRAFLIISMIVGHFAPIDADFRIYIYLSLIHILLMHLRKMKLSELFLQDLQ